MPTALKAMTNEIADQNIGFQLNLAVSECEEHNTQLYTVEVIQQFSLHDLNEAQKAFANQQLLISHWCKKPMTVVDPDSVEYKD